MLRDLAPRLPHHAEADARALALEGQAVFHRQQDLTDAEQADHRYQAVEALGQLGEAVGHAQLPGDGVHADGGEREAEHHRGDRLSERLAAHADEAAEGEQLYGEEFGRPELERELREQRREEGYQQQADQHTERDADQHEAQVGQRGRDAEAVR